MKGLNHTISGLLGDFYLLSPELVLIGGAILLAILQLVIKAEDHQIKRIVTLFILLITGWFVACCQADGFWMNDILFHSGNAAWMKYLILLTAGSILLFPNSKKLLIRGEYHFLILMVVLGTFMLMQSANLLVFYISIELISITSYVLIAFNFDKKSFEAGIKYLLFGAMASGLMLYGISLLYGMTGSLDLPDLKNVLVGQNIWIVLSLVMFLMGLLFKLAIAPMHIWSPDAYEGGPTPIVALISVAPKAAVLMFLYHFINISGLESIAFDWKKLLAILALISMFLGNLSALRQDNLKRMLAYSSIAHSGFLVLGLLPGTQLGYQAMMFYLMAYGIMNVGAFYLAGLMEKNGVYKISSLSGTGRSNPLLAVSVVVIMVALVGLPPTAGFSAKLLVFSSVYETFSQTEQSYLLWLFVVGILNASISLFYYLKIPYYMLLKPNTNAQLRVTAMENGFLVLITLFLLWLFFQADLLLNILNPTNFTF